MSLFQSAPEPPAIISVLLDQFDLAMEREGKSDKTRRAYRSDIADFFLFTGLEKVSAAVTPRDFDNLTADWLNRDRRRVAAATLQRHRSSAKAFFRLVHDMDVLTRYKAPPIPPARAHPLPNLLDDVRKILDGAHHRRTRMAIALMGFAGLRVNEVCELVWNDVEQTMIVVKGKGEKTRYVPIAPELRVEMDTYRPKMLAHPNVPVVGMDERSLRRSIKRIAKEVGVGNVASHDLRMTYGTVVYNKTKDLRLVQELLGHADPKTTERYTQVTHQRKMDALSGGLS